MALSVATLKSTSPSHAITLSYRHLYKTALRSIRYSVPSRHVLRRTIRAAFRSRTAKDFDPQRIVNTISFLERAGCSGTMERKILKTLTMVRFWDQPNVISHAPLFRRKDSPEKDMRKIPIRQYNRTLHLLNESLGICLG